MEKQADPCDREREITQPELDMKGEEKIPALEEITIEEMAIDGICGVY